MEYSGQGILSTLLHLVNFILPNICLLLVSLLMFSCNLLGKALHSSFYRLSEVSIGISVQSKQSVPITVRHFFFRKIFFKGLRSAKRIIEKNSSVSLVTCWSQVLGLDSVTVQAQNVGAKYSATCSTVRSSCYNCYKHILD